MSERRRTRRGPDRRGGGARRLQHRLRDRPITTHADAVWGDVQLKLLTSLGVPAHKIIGPSCGNRDHAYHLGT